MAKQKLDLANKTIGGYRLVREIGSGGMGVVYEAIELSLNRRVALKVLPPKLADDESFVSRFLREARSAASLNHPSIVTIFGTGEADGYYYIAMELVDGETLSALISREGQLGVRRALEIALRVAEALAFAHTKEFVHRDVKPSNIMLDRDGNAKLLDFGLAKALQGGTDLTSSGQILGTPMYMSPEQAKGDRIEAATDVYALGVLLFQMLSGTTPYPSESPLVTLNRIINEPIPDILRHNPEVSTKLAMLIGRMTAKNPDRRISSALPLVPMLSSLLHSGEGLRSSEPGVLADTPSEQAAPIRKPRRWLRAAITPTAYFAYAIAAGAAAFGFVNVLGNESYGNWTLPPVPRWSTPPDESSDDASPPSVPLEPSPFEAGTEQQFDGIEFVWIPPGTFRMGSELSSSQIAEIYGSDDAVPEASASEHPQHWVTITRGFWMSKHEVTKLQWSEVMGSRPWQDQRFSVESPNSPAENVSWNDCMKFVSKLNQRAGGVYRLPTEAEWEYACRSGSKTAFYFGSDAARLDTHAWFYDNTADRGQWHAGTVGLKTPNAWGLHDMHGNVFEWCAETPRVYGAGAETNPVNAIAEGDKVLRGGSWGSKPSRCRSSARMAAAPDVKLANYGFRLVRDPDPR